MLWLNNIYRLQITSDWKLVVRLPCSECLQQLDSGDIRYWSAWSLKSGRSHEIREWLFIGVCSSRLSTSSTGASLRLMLPVASGSTLQVAISSSCHDTVAPSSAVGRFLLQVWQPGTRQSLPDYLRDPSLAITDFLERVVSDVLCRLNSSDGITGASPLASLPRVHSVQGCRPHVKGAWQIFTMLSGTCVSSLPARRALRSVVTSCRTTCTIVDCRWPSIQPPRIWNSLSDYVISAESFNVFRTDQIIFLNDPLTNI